MTASIKIGPLLFHRTARAVFLLELLFSWRSMQLLNLTNLLRYKITQNATTSSMVQTMVSLSIKNYFTLSVSAPLVL